MSLREECVHLVRPFVECDRVCPCLRRNCFDPNPLGHVDHVDHARVTDRHIEMGQLAVQKNDVGWPRQIECPDYLPGSRIQTDRLPLITRAVQPVLERVQIEAVRPLCGYVEESEIALGMSCVQHRDPGWLRNLHEEYILR